MNANVIGQPRVVQGPQGGFLKLVFKVHIEGRDDVEVTSRGPASLSASGLKTAEEASAVLGAVRSYLGSHPEAMKLYPSSKIPTDRSATIELSPAALRALGEALEPAPMAALMSCMVHLDRLTSLTEMLRPAADEPEEGSITARRNRETLCGLAAGVLLGVLGALELLEKAGAGAGAPEQEPFESLWRFATRMRQNRWLELFHQLIGSRLDQDLISAGLAEITKGQDDVKLFNAGEDGYPGSFPLGWKTIEQGLQSDVYEGAAGGRQVPNVASFTTMICLCQQELLKLFPRAISQLLIGAPPPVA